MPYELLDFSNDADLAKQVTSDWLEELRKRDHSKPYSVALSGGRIANTFFAEITRQAKASGDAQLFYHVHFFWADERCVPPDDPESNYNVARKLLFEPLSILEGNIHRLRGEGDEKVALKDAISELKSVTERGQNGQPVMDLIFLGTGEDGHTASLFPGELPEVVNDPAVYRAVTAVKLPPRRITLGYAVIAAAKKVWVLVSGKGKEASFAETLSPNGTTPLGRVLQERQTTRLYSDVKPKK